ncbi:MAG: N-acetylmuramoyl-L-alanine amidase [Agathobacter sp.]|nr:N-acetylmuramoyl-L-alanine amidase [Agathobacter sp.]
MPAFKEGFTAATWEIPDFGLHESPVEIEETVVLQEDKLNIELPEGVQGSDVQIENDYINHIVYVRFSKAIDNYSENYIVQGSSDHIANLSYYKEDGEGVLEINLDKACEHFYTFKDGFLRMEFKDLHEVYEKIIVVDAGHGGSQPGAVKKDIYEKHLNLDIVLKLKELLDEVDEKKLKVFYTRLEDTNPSLMDRAYMANQLDANLFISVHNNASADGKFSSLNGTMVLYSPDENDDSSKRLAQICLENVNASTGSKDLGLVEADHIYIIRASEVPVALIEVGYMTNTTELDNLCTPEYQKKVAQGIYNAIMQAFEEGF